MDNENLLNSIYQNIAMVLETIPEIRKVTTDCDFKTKLKAMSDKNVSHLSEMCIQGYTMGMIKAIQKNHFYCDASKEAKHFGDKLISLHEKSIQDLKKYL